MFLAHLLNWIKFLEISKNVKRLKISTNTGDVTSRTAFLKKQKKLLIAEPALFTEKVK